MTKHAKTILELIETSHSHMTAEQVFSALRQVYPKVALATVYNNLNRLWQEGLIRKVSMEGMPDRYDRIARHDHLVCQGCGKLVDVDLGDLTQRLQAQVEVPILAYDLKLMCLCPECRSRQEKAT